MNMTVITKTYPEPAISFQEILRYAGAGTGEPDTVKLMNDCLEEVRSALSYKVCYIETDVMTDGYSCDFGIFKLSSKNLAHNLCHCHKAIIFAATIGTQLDRLISRYGRIAPAKGLMMQAIGTERIESLCNCFCADFAAERGIALTPRFSSGYGDLPLETQKDIFNILNPEKHIGLTLNNSLLMSPSKSVTAFVGISENIDK